MDIENIDYLISGNHSELEFIKSHPDLISCIFEDKLRSIKYVDGDIDEYIKKLNKLKRELEELIIRWV